MQTTKDDKNVRKQAFITKLFPVALVIVLAGCAGPKNLHEVEPKLQFAWRQTEDARTDLRAVPDLAPHFLENTRAALLRSVETNNKELSPTLSDEDDLTFRPDAPSEKDWRFLNRRTKGPAIIGASLSFDLTERNWTARTGVVKRGSRSGFTPQLVLSFEDMEF